ncbi:MAG: PH domain-containing protein [Actinomycetota bacterium]|nr:PH domain-containing protein [Actinomycetota bacterium]MDH4352577.1 PH domain-containing protein [Actinomycetota bacterium]
MAYPDRLLTAGEVVEYDMRPHWRMLTLPAVALVGIVFVGVYVLTALPPEWDPARWLVAVVLAVLLVWWVIGPAVRWATTQYVLTNRRVIVRSGIVARQGRDMPLARVNDVHFAYTVVDRLLGCGTLVVESAAESGQLVIRAVPDVELVQREVFRLHEEDDLRRRRSGA